MIETIIDVVPPQWLISAARRVGIKLLSRRGLSPADWARYYDVDMGVWLEAHRRFHRLLSKIARDTDGHELALCRVSGLTADQARDALVQCCNNEFFYPFMFVSVCSAAYPDARVVVRIPRELRDALRRDGCRINERLSACFTAIWRLAARFQAIGLNTLQGGLLVRDELWPNLVPLSEDEIPVILSGVMPSEMSELSTGLNASDFVAAKRLPPLRDGAAALIEGDPACRHAPPAHLVPDMLRMRRKASSSIRKIFEAVAEQLRLTKAAVSGGWREQLLARDASMMPRARRFTASMRPRDIVANISALRKFPAWYDLVRRNGGLLHILCISTQVKYCQWRHGFVPDVIPGLYQYMDGDRYYVWDHHHRRHLIEAGAAGDKVEVVGPVILSAYPSRNKSRPTAVPIIDYFDQPPERPLKILHAGAPRTYESYEVAERALRGALEASRAAFPRFLFRLKMKRPNSPNVDARYRALLDELAKKYPELVVDREAKSPLQYHVDGDVTIGFPFVSPVVSAAYYGIPACFYDPTGELAVEEGQSHGLPVHGDVGALTAWLAAQAKAVTAAPQDAALH